MNEFASEDTAVLRRITDGDEDALITLHRRYVNLVYSMALRVLGDRQLAEEVTQDVFMKIWQKGHRYEPSRGHFATWLLGITRFAAIDRLRKEGRRSTYPLENDETETWQMVEQESWERGQQLRLLCQQIPPEQRRLIELTYFGGMSHRDLAEQLDLPLGTVKSRLRLGLQKLRDLWLEGMPQGGS